MSAPFTAAEGFKTEHLKHELEKQTYWQVGIQRARVEYHNDPLRIGRVKVRITSLHGISLTGIEEHIPVKSLPWATPCHPGGIGQDFGTFIPPCPGTFVWVMFEDGDRDKPVYMGGIPSAKYWASHRKMNEMAGEWTPLPIYWTNIDWWDTPLDVFRDKQNIADSLPISNVTY